jgi:hypothetical protein
MAFSHYAAAAESPCYALVARDILQAIRSSTQCNDKLKGYMARLPPYQNFYRSTEHNIDMFALGRMLGEKDVEESASHFVQKMFGFTYNDEDKNSYFSTGTGADGKCDTKMVSAAIPMDAQFWNVLADASGQSSEAALHMATALNASLRPTLQHGFVEKDTDRTGNKDGAGKGNTLTGFRFSTYGTGAQWEVTASGVMGLLHNSAKTHTPVPTIVSSMRKSLTGMLETYGSILASVNGGNMDAYYHTDKMVAALGKRVAADYPGGSNTGIGWTYLRYPHLAATAWTGMLLLYQAEDGGAVDESFNPYAPPKRRVPSAAAGIQAAATCLPAQRSASSDGASAACSAHPKCAGLEGDCCPTSSGMHLGCC